jgi:hypothetical protein
MSLGDLGISTVNGGAIGVKNAIINGNFAVNQRAVSGTVTLAAGAYGHDRFKAGASGCTYTFATANNITTLTISAGSLIQVIEGNNLFTGTYTLSWVGTAQGKIGGGSYASSGVTGTPAGGTDLNIEFNTGTLSLVQFEPGAIATPFERRPYGQELLLCQRYYFKFLVTSGSSSFGSGFAESSTVALCVMNFPTSMRTAPSALETTGTAANYRIRYRGTNTACSVVPSNFANEATNATFRFTVASGLTAGDGVMGSTNSSSAYLAWSAEL